MNVYHGTINDCEIEFTPICYEGADWLINKLNDAYVYSELKSSRNDTMKDFEEGQRYKHPAFRTSSP